MRRTSGRPANAASIGIAMPVSSSSAPIAAFWTMTLNTGAERSGKTSRRRFCKETAPNTVPATAKIRASADFANDARMRRSIMSVLLVLARGLLGFGFQEKCAIDDDLLSGAQARQNFDFASQIPTTSDWPNFKAAGILRHEDAPTVTNPLQRCGGNSQQHAGFVADRQP